MSRLAWVSSVMCMLGVLGCYPGPDETASYSTPVGINIDVDSKDADNGVVSETKLIQVEVGNPYAVFIATARDRLSRDPSAIGVDRIDLRLGAESVGVTTLGEVFAGSVEVLFQTLVTDNSYPVAIAEIDGASAAGPIELAISFDPSNIPDADYLYFLDGTFKVCVRGPAAPTFNKGVKAEADLQITLQFIAFD